MNCPLFGFILLYVFCHAFSYYTNSGLLFSDAPEITGLANLPLGLAVGPVYQPIDVSHIDCMDAVGKKVRGLIPK